MRKNQIVIYQGEGFGGCTGDDQFHEYLFSDNFVHLPITEVLDNFHVTFPTMHDRFYVYQKIN